jgi:hypothetical protein
MKRFKLAWNLLAVMTVALVSCHKDLDRLPTNGEFSEETFATHEGYVAVAARVYSAFATTSGEGPGSTDLRAGDAGFSDFYRCLWYTQTLSSDEGILAWNDPGVQDFQNLNWAASNDVLRLLYQRSFLQITRANDFLREATPEKVAARGITGANADNIKRLVAEVRFLRAFQYWVLMDVFGNPGFATEANTIGAAPPAQIRRDSLFNWLERELKAIEPELADPRTNQYGRADKGAAWALLSRMYLNSQVYTGVARYSQCIEYSKKVIDAGYTLEADYRHLFLADNHLSRGEIIFPIVYDGRKVQTFGGTTFLVHAGIVPGMNAAELGVSGSGWSGIRAKKSLPDLFPDPSGSTDKRAMFYRTNPIDIAQPSNASEGWPVMKYKNLTRSGQTGNDRPALQFVDSDVPLFRLAEMYLNYAEAVVRGGTGGTTSQALTYINQLRARAFGNSDNNFTSLTLQNLLAERGREMYWEGLRRVDLVRYNLFTTGDYLWPWKGGSVNGTSVPNFRNIYPLPTLEVNGNPNLIQNPNY